jgi:Cu-processing system permease protein
MTTAPGSLHQIGVITRLTFHEARRRKLLWLGLAMGLTFIALFSTGFYFAYSDFTRSMDRMTGREFTMFSSTFLTVGLYVVNFLVVMVTVLTAVGTISSEIANNTIHAIAAKPIRRWEIVLGKWLGHAAMMTLYTAMLALGVMIPIFVITGYLPPNPLGGLLTLILESLTVLSVTLLGGTILGTLANGVLCFMLYGVAFVGGWVEQIGTLFNSQTARDIGIAASLLMPSEALWRYAATLMQPATLFGLQISPFSVTSQPSPAFVVYAAIYTLALLGLAMWVFSRRDF